MKTTLIAMGLGLSFLAACGSKSDSKKDPAPAVASPAPAPAPEPKPEDPAPIAAGKGFFFVNAETIAIPVFVRGDMNGWLGGEPSPETLSASKLLFDETTGCYTGKLELNAGEYGFKLATYLPEAANSGWGFLKFGLGAAGTKTAVEVGSETKIDVYYFPAGDADGKDSGGGGDLLLSVASKTAYTFKLCTGLEDYTQAKLTISNN